MTTFLGKPSVETRTMRDANGNVIQTLTVEHESPWDDDSREAAIALWEYEQGLCPQCHGPREVCSDPNAPWDLDREVCYRQLNLDWIRRKRDTLTGQKEATDVIDSEGFHVEDGVTYTALSRRAENDERDWWQLRATE